jgi:hypothetical protein
MSEKFDSINKINQVDYSSKYKNIELYKGDDDDEDNRIEIDNYKPLISQPIFRKFKNMRDRITHYKILNNIKVDDMDEIYKSDYNNYNPNSICRYTDGYCDYCEMPKVNEEGYKMDHKKLTSTEINIYSSYQKNANKICNNWKVLKDIMKNTFLFIAPSATDNTYNNKLINMCKENYKRLAILLKSSFVDTSFLNKTSEEQKEYINKILAMIISGILHVSYYAAEANWSELLLTEVVTIESLLKEQGKDMFNYIIPDFAADLEYLKKINEKFKLNNNDKIDNTFILNLQQKNIEFLNDQEKYLSNAFNEKSQFDSDNCDIDQDTIKEIKDVKLNGGNYTNISNNDDIFVNKKMQEYFNNYYFKIDNNNYQDQYGGQIDNEDIYKKFQNIYNTNKKIAEEKYTQVVHLEVIMKTIHQIEVSKYIEKYNQQWKLMEASNIKKKYTSDKIELEFSKNKILEIMINKLIYNGTSVYTIENHKNIIIKDLIENYNILLQEIAKNVYYIGSKLEIINNQIDKTTKKIQEDKTQIAKDKQYIKKTLEKLGEIKSIIDQLIGSDTYSSSSLAIKKLEWDESYNSNTSAGKKIGGSSEETSNADESSQSLGLARKMSDSTSWYDFFANEASDAKNTVKTTIYISAASILAPYYQSTKDAGAKFLLQIKGINKMYLVIIGVLLYITYMNRDWIYYIIGLWRWSGFKAILDSTDANSDLKYYKIFATSVLNDWNYENTNFIYKFFHFYILGKRPTYLNRQLDNGNWNENGDTDHARLLISIIDADIFYDKNEYTLIQLNNIYKGVDTTDIFYTLTTKLASVNHYDYVYPATTDNFQEVLNKIIYNTVFDSDFNSTITSESDIDKLLNLKKHLTKSDSKETDHTNILPNRNIDFSNIKAKFKYDDMISKLKLEISKRMYKRKKIELILLHLMENLTKILLLAPENIKKGSKGGSKKYEKDITFINIS